MLILLILGILHLFVDYFANFSIANLPFGDTYMVWLVLAYNILAFVTQPIIGYFVDKSHPKNLVTFSIVMLAVGFLFVNVTAPFGIIFLGLSNSLFHVAAGKIIIERSRGRMAPLGVFVAPGAIGVALAWALPENDNLMAWVFLVAALAFTAYIFLPVKKPKEPFPSPVDHISAPAVAIIAIAVIIRAFLGKYVTYGINIPLWVLYAGLAAFGGKLAGGYLADRIGIKWTVVISSVLGLASLFFTDNLVISLIGMVSINLAMPITLGLIVRALPKYPSVAFGLAAMALVPGVYLGSFLGSQYYVAVAIIAMLVNPALILFAGRLLSHKKDA